MGSKFKNHKIQLYSKWNSNENKMKSGIEYYILCNAKGSFPLNSAFGNEDART